MEAHMSRSVLTVLVTSVAILCGVHDASAQPRCPHSTSDYCDQWNFEEIDKQLAQVIADAVEKIENLLLPTRDRTPRKH
jgi:hypothetical protein